MPIDLRSKYINPSWLVSFSAGKLTGILSPANGGTGVNNGDSTFTIGGDASFIGNYSFAGTLIGNTAVTFPTSGTLATTDDTVLSIEGTANQVLVNGTSGTPENGDVILSLPQDIDTSSSPQFTGLNLSSTTVSELLATDSLKNVISAAGGTYNINISGNAATVTTNANLTGDVTSIGNATTVVKINGATLGTATATSGNLLIGSGTSWVTNAMSGDITINSTGVTAIGINKVTGAMFRQSGALSLVGNPTNSTANVSDIVSSADGQVFRRSGAAIGFGQIDLANANAVTGILPNGNTTANTTAVSTIVLRDASGNFTAGTISASGLNLSGLTASSLTATDSGKNLTSSVSGLSPTFTALTLTQSSAFNTAITLNNTNGSSYKNQISFQNSGANKYSLGVDYNQAQDSNFWIYDNVASARRLFIDNAGKLTIDATTDSTSITTGALNVSGGIGVSKRLNVGTSISLQGGGTSGNDLFIRSNTDTNHGLGWYGSAKTFASQTPDGPVLYGYSGGILGTMITAPARSLSWDTTSVTVNLTTSSTSTTTGALIVSGGTGISGTAHIGTNLAVGGSGSFGGGSKVVFLANATAPTSNPTGGGILYADSGAGKWRGSGGTVTTFGPAEPHCPVCDSDFGLEWENEKYGGTLQICMKCLSKELGHRDYIRWQKAV